MQSSKMHQFVGIASQKLLLEVVKVCTSLQAGRTPEWPTIVNDHMAEIKLMVGFFCKAPWGNSAASTAQVVKGKAGM